MEMPDPPRDFPGVLPFCAESNPDSNGPAENQRKPGERGNRCANFIVRLADTS